MSQKKPGVVRSTTNYDIIWDGVAYVIEFKNCTAAVDELQDAAEFVQEKLCDHQRVVILDTCVRDRLAITVYFRCQACGYRSEAEFDADFLWERA